MDDIFEKLYAIHLDTENFPCGKPKKEEMDEEWELYHFLYENLTDNCKQAFLRYAELIVNRQEQERRAVYEYGFKTGVRLLIQALAVQD